MKKGFVGFIFGVVSVIAALLGILKKMAGVTNVVSHLKDDLSEGFMHLIIDRQNALEALVFDTEEEARDIFEKLVEVSDGKKLTVEQFLNVADLDGDIDHKYLDSKFGWWYDKFFDNCNRIEKDEHYETYHFIIPRPVCLGEDSK